jgi:5-(carboxyamino)imidazole ribonucleotide synthase
VSDLSSFERAIKEMGTPCLLKTAELGYDGKGQHKIDCKSSCEQIWSGFTSDVGIVEEWVPFEIEISVVAARGLDGEYKPFSPVQNIHKEGILDTTIAPAGIGHDLANEACHRARLIMDELNYVGVLAVEYFVTAEDKLLVNEIAPRPHNSGHWTIDACFTSQFEQHIRAICGLPLGNPAWHSRAMMKNLIGLEVQNWKNFLGDSQAKIHLYGKQECKPGRKMGHVTQLDPR